MAAFSELSFAVRWQGRLVLRTAVLSNGKLLTTAAMVAYLAEKVEKCLLNRVVKYCLRTIRTADAVRNTE